MEILNTICMNCRRACNICIFAFSIIITVIIPEYGWYTTDSVSTEWCCCTTADTLNSVRFSSTVTTAATSWVSMELNIPNRYPLQMSKMSARTLGQQCFNRYNVQKCLLTHRDNQPIKKPAVQGSNFPFFLFTSQVALFLSFIFSSSFFLMWNTISQHFQLAYFQKSELATMTVNKRSKRTLLRLFTVLKQMITFRFLSLTQESDTLTVRKL